MERSVALIRHCHPGLPRLAWLCERRRDTPDILLHHGPGVEIGTDFFFEGAWAGDFAEADFLECDCFGTGGRLEGDDLVLAPPDHPIDRLYLYRERDRFLASNSIAFLAEYLGKSIASDRADHFQIFGEFMHGIDHFQSRMPLEDGTEIELSIWHILRIGPDLSVGREDKDRHAPLPDFRAYERHLLDVMGRVFANATAPGRVSRFEPLTTISSGYDSTMISALASDLGCMSAVTYEKSRAALLRGVGDDSGHEAAKALGLDVTVVDRLGFRASEDMPEIMALGHGSEFLSARHAFAGRLVVVGFMGDTMWDRIPGVVSDSIKVLRPASHNVTELRLAHGFVFFPVPFIACRQQPAIVRITQSEEMAPWTLGTNYDRPICRRIAETRGVPRESFGMRKLATAVFHREEGLARTMTPASYADYIDYRTAKLGGSPRLARLIDRATRFTRLGNRIADNLAIRLKRKSGISLRIPRLPDTGGMRSEAALLFPWAVERLRPRYRLGQTAETARRSETG